MMCKIKNETDADQTVFSGWQLEAKDNADTDGWKLGEVQHGLIQHQLSQAWVSAGNDKEKKLIFRGFHFATVD